MSSVGLKWIGHNDFVSEFVVAFFTADTLTGHFDCVVSLVAFAATAEIVGAATFFGLALDGFVGFAFAFAMA